MHNNDPSTVYTHTYHLHSIYSIYNYKEKNLLHKIHTYHSVRVYTCSAPQGIKTGTNALKIATQLVKGVFPTTGPVVRNGEIQTKWGSYALPNPQDADVIDKLLQATRDLIQKMTINV